MSKQDAYSPRTAADLERKYNFGQTFAKVFGLVDDAVRAAEDAKSAIDGLDQEQIFNLLTNYGTAQGIYRDDNGDVYVNASYIKSGKLSAAYIDTEGLSIKTGNVDGLEAWLAQHNNDEQAHDNQFAVIKEDINGLKVIVGVVEDDISLAQKLAMLDASLDDCLDDVNDHATRITKVETSLTEIGTKMEGYDEDILDHAGQLVALNKEITGYQDDVKEYAGQVSQFTQKVGGFETLVIGYQKSVDGYTAEYSTFNQTATDITAKVGSLETGMSQTVRLTADGLTITNADGEALEIDGGQIKANSITAEQINVEGLYVGELHSEGRYSYQTVDIYDGMIEFYSGYIHDSGWGTLTVYGNTLAFRTEDSIQFKMPNGRYFELASGAFCYREEDGSLISQAVFN